MKKYARCINSWLDWTKRLGGQPQQRDPQIKKASVLFPSREYYYLKGKTAAKYYFGRAPIDNSKGYGAGPSIGKKSNNGPYNAVRGSTGGGATRDGPGAVRRYDTRILVRRSSSGDGDGYGIEIVLRCDPASAGDPAGMAREAREEAAPSRAAGEHGPSRAPVPGGASRSDVSPEAGGTLDVDYKGGLTLDEIMLELGRYVGDDVDSCVEAIDRSGLCGTSLVITVLELEMTEWYHEFCCDIVPTLP